MTNNVYYIVTDLLAIHGPLEAIVIAPDEEAAFEVLMSENEARYAARRELELDNYPDAYDEILSERTRSAALAVLRRGAEITVLDLSSTAVALVRWNDC